MTTNDGNERKPLLELRGRGFCGGDGSGGRPRLPPQTRSLLFFVISLAACGFLTWWLWARFRIRFYFIFIPLIGIGGPIFGRPRRRTGEKRRLLEDRGDEDVEKEDGTPPGDGKS